MSDTGNLSRVSPGCHWRPQVWENWHLKMDLLDFHKLQLSSNRIWQWNENELSQSKVTMSGHKLHSFMCPERILIYFHKKRKKWKHYVPSCRWQSCSVKCNCKKTVAVSLTWQVGFFSLSLQHQNALRLFQDLYCYTMMMDGGINKVSTDAFCLLHYIRYHLIRPGSECFKCDSFYIACKHCVFFFKCW